MEMYNLTCSQKNIWDTQRFFSTSSIANIGGAIKLSDYPVDFDKWNQALNIVVKNNDALRIKILEKEGQPFQYFDNYEEKNYEVVDFSNFTEEEIKRTFDKWMSKTLIPSGELIDLKLIKFSDSESGIFMLANHMVTDAYSIGLMSQEVTTVYDALVNNKARNDIENLSYKKFIERDSSYLNSKRFKKDKEYWDNVFNEIPQNITIANSQSLGIQAARYIEKLDGNFAIAIKDFCKKQGVSEAVFFESLIIIYINKVTSEDDITIGIPILNRISKSERKISGMFVSTLMMRVNVVNKSSFIDFCKIVKNQKIALFRHQQFQYSHIQDMLRDKFGYTGNLFEVVVSYQNASVISKDVELDISTDWVFNKALVNNIIFNIDDRDNNNEFLLSVDYQTESFSNEEIINIINRLKTIINKVIENPEISFIDIDMLTDFDRAIYKEFNQEPKKIITTDVVFEFEYQVKENGNKIALEFQGKTYTYSQLNAMANSLAHDIELLGFRENEIIPIVGGRSLYTIVSLLAVIKTGNGYFLIDDNEYPKGRIDYLISEVNAKVLIKHSTKYSKDDVKEIDLSSSYKWNKDISNLENKLKLTDTLCALHTSGSTGLPKVVLISHEAVVNMAKNNSHIIEGSNTFISLMTMVFDAFLEDTMLPLLNGKKLVLSTNEELKSISLTEKLISRHENSAIDLTPTRLKQYLKNNNNDAWQGINNIILGGEKIDQELLTLIKKKMNKPNIHNLYGPTETTVFNCGKKIVNGNTDLGKPVTNFNIYIVDKNNNMLPPGVVGEIVVAGSGLAKGYMNQDELNAQKFIINPATGERVYKTGDFGIINEKCELVFKGRRDNQIKINGLRIEIGEIEASMKSFQGIEDAAIAIKNNNNESFLVGYYTSDSEIDISLLIAYMENNLPLYMVPKVFKKLDNMPLTQSGKLDKNNLPDVDLNEIANLNFVVPENDLEEKLCAIWENILNVKTVGTNSTFYSLGGTSKSMIEMILKIEKIVNVGLSPTYFPKNPTIKNISDVIENLGKSRVINLDEYNFNGLRVENYNNKTGVLLTGGSGYLGSHILENLLETTDAHIYCLLRNEENYNKNISYYFGDKLDQYHERITLLKGDISQENFGLSADDYSLISEEVGIVMNSAANVGHFEALDASKISNVDGVYNLIRFAMSNGSKMNHMSTITISGIGITKQEQENYIFNENDLDIGQDFTGDSYMHTKFKAEQLISKAMEMGAIINVYRMGAITKRSYDGKFQINEDKSGFSMIINSISDFGIIPKSAISAKVQSVPVDKAAEAVVGLSINGVQNRTYHIYDPEITELTKYLNKIGLNYRILDDDKFTNIVENIIENSKRETYIIGYKYLKNYLRNLSSNDVSNYMTMSELERIGFRYNDTKIK